MNRQFFFGIVLAAIFGATATLGAGQTGDAVLAGRVSEAGSGKPLAGIRVTNGSDVVLTGADGRYQLPRHPGLRTRFVSVVVPGNFSCETRYRPAAEGGGDFVLAPRPRRSGFTFIHVGDTETTKYDRHLNEIMAYARNTGAAFIIHTGDLSGKANKKQLAKDPENARWRTAIDFHADRLNAQHAGRPVYYTIGNHDMRGRYGESLWESRLGPVVYAFEEGDCLFVALPIAKGDVMPFDRPDDTAKFLKNLLATYPATQKVFLLSHSQTPLDCHGVFLKGSRYEVDLRQWDFLGMIHGHNHRSSVTPCGSRAAIWSTAMSSGGGRGNTPACFREFRVSADGKVSSELRYLYQERQLHGVVSPKPDADGRYPVAAVAYHTVMPVVKVVAERGGEKIELSRRSPMLWCGSFTTAGEAPLRTTATFADGSTLAAENATLRDGRLKLRRMIPLRQETRLGAPVTDGERIFVSTIDDHNGRDGGLTAFDAATGKLRWQLDCGAGLRNRAALADGELAVIADGGKLMLLDAASGKVKWSLAPTVPYYPCRSPLLVGDTVYSTFDRMTAAVARADGTVRWRNENVRDGFGSPSPFLLAGGRLIAAVNWGFVNALDPADGRTIWQSERQKTGPAFLLQPTVERLPDGNILAATDRFVAELDARNGRIVKTADPRARGATAGTPVVDRDLIFIGTPKFGLAALDTTTLELRWHTRRTTGKSALATVQYMPGGVNTVEAAPLPLGDEVFCAHTCGKLYRLERRSGKVLSELDLGSPLLSSPVRLGKDRLMINDFAGRLFIFDIVP